MRQQQTWRERIRGVVRFDEPLKSHTTIQVGGPADVWIEPADRDDAVAAVRALEAEGLPWYCLGRGSNVIVRDGGLRGAVVHVGALEGLTMDATVLTAEAGVRIKRLLGFCAEHGLAGVEGLEGVPGMVGGAIVMNAGTPAGCIGDAVLDVTYCDRHGKLAAKTHAQLEFGYRRTKLPRQCLLLAVRLQLRADTPAAVRERLEQLRAKRQDAQPGHQPSVGSVFKNPPGTAAWKLIREAGVQGVRIGGARVSDRHANWIVNEGAATARDVEVLIRLIRDRVKDASGILLEPEVIVVGEEK